MVKTLGLPGRQKPPSQQGDCRVQNSVRLICDENRLGFDHASINRVPPLFHHPPRHSCSDRRTEGAGCVEVFAEKVSFCAPLEKRHQLRACLETLQKGDELVVSKLDRLGRRSQVEVERSLIQERTRESLEHRRKTGGNLGGRPRTTEKKNALCCV